MNTWKREEVVGGEGEGGDTCKLMKTWKREEGGSETRQGIKSSSALAVHTILMTSTVTTRVTNGNAQRAHHENGTTWCIVGILMGTRNAP